MPEVRLALLLLVLTSGCVHYERCETLTSVGAYFAPTQPADVKVCQTGTLP